MEVLIQLLFHIVVGTLLGAVMLRAAVAIYNWINKTKQGFVKVPDASFNEAMLIVFVANVVNAVLGVVAGLILRSSVGRDSGLFAALILVVGLLVQLLVVALMIRSRWRLETGRAWMLAGYYFLVSLAFGLCLVGVAVSIGTLVVR